MAGEQKYTVDIGVTGLNNLNKLQTNIDGLHQRMMGLKTIIASGLFAGLGAGALRMADDLQDLANSTGIATARLLEFKKALVENGGASETMAQGVTTFVRSIDEAAQGSLKAQNTFRDLGITMTDLRTLGEQELMVKALKGIGGITNASRRASIQMDLFGKSFRTVDAKGLAEGLEKSAGSADKYAAALKRGAELNDALATASGNVKLAFLEAFAPAIKAINEFNTATSEGTARMDLLIAAIKIAGTLLVTAFSVGVLLPMVTAIGTLGRGIGVVAGALGSAGIATWAASAFRALGPLMSGLRVIALLFSAGLGIYTATQLFDDFGSVASNALARVVEGIGEMVASILNLEPLTAIINGLLGTSLDFSNAAGNGVQALVDKARASREAYEKLRQEQKKLSDEGKKTSDASKEQADAIKRAVDTSAYDNAVKGIKKVGEGYKENGRRILENIELEKLSIGNTKEANDLEAARVALSNRSYDAVQQLREAQATMSKELKDAGLGKVYDEEIAKIEQLARVEGARLEQLISGLAKAKAAEELRLFGIKQQYDVEDKLLGIQREMADLTLTDIEKKYRDIVRAADDSAKAAVRAEEARRGEKLNSQEVEAYYKKSREGIESIITAQKKLNTEARTFGTGWKKAWADFTDNATNAAQAATRLFDKFTSGIEDALVDFAKTGKLNWKSFVADMAEELLRSQIKQTLASVLQVQNPFSSGGSSIGDSLGGLFGGLLGGSGGATKGQSANNPMYVLDVSSGSGGGILGGIMGPQQQGGSDGGIMGTIGNIFGGVKDAVGSVFGGIGNAVSGVASSIGGLISGGGIGGGSGGGFLDGIIGGIGDLFGGFFANGGAIPAGKFGMVGERGPELIGGPANITPMGGSTNVTYNIQAVDARSFQQLLASDPSFIFALTEQGRKSFAGAR